MGLDYRVRCCPDGLMTDRRRKVQVVDCTIRDGGCCNQWKFDERLVKETFQALVSSGIEVMEVGYQTTPGVFSPDDVGPWRFCDERVLEQVVEPSDMKLACMVDVGRFTPKDLRPARDSLVDIIRVATYAKDIEVALGIMEQAQALGYEVYCNVMAVTTCTPQEVDTFLEKLRNSPVSHVTVVDSYGAMYPHQLRYLIRKYKNWLRGDQRVGVHLHNSQQTAFANSIAAIDEGADYVDATIFGMGRGAGNCPLELLLMYLDNPRYNLTPILALIDQYERLREELRWGYQVPYGVSGWLNRHPKNAIDAVQGNTPYQALDFYERLEKERPIPRHHRPKRET